MEVLALWRGGGPEAMVVVLKENRIADLSSYSASGRNRRGLLEGRVASQTCRSSFSSHVWLDAQTVAPHFLSGRKMSRSQSLCCVPGASWHPGLCCLWEAFCKRPAVDPVVTERGLWCFNLSLLLMILHCPFMNISCLVPPLAVSPLPFEKQVIYLKTFSGLSVWGPGKLLPLLLQKSESTQVLTCECVHLCTHVHTHYPPPAPDFTLATLASSPCPDSCQWNVEG